MSLAPAFHRVVRLLRLLLVCTTLVFVQAPAQAAPVLDTVVMVTGSGDGDPAPLPVPEAQRNPCTPRIAPYPALPACARPVARPIPASVRIYLRHCSLLR